MAIRITLHGDRERQRVLQWVASAPPLYRVVLDEPARSKDQNAAMWAALDDIAEQLSWHGQPYTSEDWKDYFMHALKRARWMPFEDGGMVPIGMSTSRLSHRDFGDLLHVIHEFGARHGVSFHDPDSTAAKEGVAQQATPVAA
jgi:hypothetical protein